MEYAACDGGRLPGRDPAWSGAFIPSGQQHAADRIYGCAVYVGNVGVRDRTGNGSPGVPVYIVRQGHTAPADPDRRAWGDRLRDAVFIFAEQKDHHPGKSGA